MSTGSSSSGYRAASIAAWWDPRRSLGARLLWILVPTFLLAAGLYRVVSTRLYGRNEKALTALLVSEAERVEALELRQSAERRTRQLDERIAEILGVLKEASDLAGGVLSERADPGSVEALVDDGRGPFRSRDAGPSAVFVSREAGMTVPARRDLAATRRLEPGFTALAAGHGQLSALFIVTRTGVLRAVPWRGLSEEAQRAYASFRIPDRWPERLVAGASPPPVFWTAPYEDLYARRGRIVTAMQAVYDRSGALVGEVGVDWVFGELFSRAPDVSHPGEIELVFDRDGTLLVKLPVSPRTLWLEGALLADVFRRVGARPERTERARIAGQELLLESRAVTGVGWTYTRLLPLQSVGRTVVQQLAPVFAENRAGRERVENATAAAAVVVGLLLVAVARNAVAPVRRLARYADRIAEGTALPAPDAVGRKDEVGRLARAMERLAQRIDRRIATMRGMHDVARTASLMTSGGETHAVICARVAELVGAAKSWIATWDPERRALAFVPPGYGVTAERLLGVRIGLDERALAMTAFRTGETFVSNDVANDPRVDRGIADSLGVENNALFVPLKTEAGTLGVLVVCDKPGGFDSEDEAAVVGWADQAALLIRNARLYEELQRSYDRLREAQRNRDYFLQNVNHELRTPLTAIMGWSEVIAEDSPPPHALKTAVEQIRRSAQYLLTLISDLLDLSRVEEGATRLETATTDLGGLVVEAIEPVAVMAQGKGIVITVTAPARGDQMACLDPVRVRQALWNLVHNAVKFTPKGGRIDVTAERGEGRDILLRVEDSGVGVDPKDLPFIFDRFRQGDGSTTRAYRGTGIGLSLAKAYVELHGGTIEVESGPGRGAVFTIRIPDAARSNSSGELPMPA